MFSGVMSRWTSPSQLPSARAAAVGVLQRRQHLIGDVQDGGGRQRALLAGHHPAGQRADVPAGDVFRGQVVAAVDLALGVDADDAG